MRTISPRLERYAYVSQGAARLNARDRGGDGGYCFNFFISVRLLCAGPCAEKAQERTKFERGKRCPPIPPETTCPSANGALAFALPAGGFAPAGAATLAAAPPLEWGRGLSVTLKLDSGQFVTEGSPSRLYRLPEAEALRIQADEMRKSGGGEVTKSCGGGSAVLKTAYVSERGGARSENGKRGGGRGVKVSLRYSADSNGEFRLAVDA